MSTVQGLFALPKTDQSRDPILVPATWTEITEPEDPTWTEIVTDGSDL
jgi:hypothetical protein